MLDFVSSIFGFLRTYFYLLYDVKIKMANLLLQLKTNIIELINY